MTDERLVEIYLQLEYLDQLRRSSHSRRLRANTLLIEDDLIQRLRTLGVTDVDEFKEKMAGEAASSTPHPKHLANA